MSDKNGGPAFPWCGDLNECPTINLGMSVRDYFAAKAMDAILSAPIGKFTHSNFAEASVSAWAMADAMLAERAK